MSVYIYHAHFATQAQKIECPLKHCTSQKGDKLTLSECTAARWRKMTSDDAADARDATPPPPSKRSRTSSRQEEEEEEDTDEDTGEEEEEEESDTAGDGQSTTTTTQRETHPQHLLPVRPAIRTNTVSLQQHARPQIPPAPQTRSLPRPSRRIAPMRVDPPPPPSNARNMSDFIVGDLDSRYSHPGE